MRQLWLLEQIIKISVAMSCDGVLFTQEILYK